jgi:lipopolysaccharide exporter
MSAAPSPTRDLKTRVAAGAGWMVALRWTDRLIALVNISVLARLLTPADFGIVAYATLLIGMVDLFTQFSTNAALIRDQEATRARYDAAWTLNAIRGVAIALVIAALAAPAAAYFREPAMLPVALWLALTTAIHGFENVGTVDFQKHLTFSRHFVLRLVPRLLSVAVTIALALIWRDHWALVAGMIVHASTMCAFGYVMHPFRPRPRLEGSGALLRFSGWVTVASLFHGIGDRLPGLVLGRVADASAMALFGTARDFAALASSELRAPIRAALFPGLSKIIGDPVQLRNALIEATGVLTLLCLPVPLGIAFVAGDLVPLVLGERWIDATPLLRVLALGGAIAALGANSHLLLMVTGRADLVAITTGLHLAVLVPLCFLLIPAQGAIGAAHALVASSLVALVSEYVLSSWRLGISATRFLAVIWRPVLAAAAMCAVLALLGAMLAPAVDWHGRLLRVILFAGAGAAIYPAVALALARVAGARDGAEHRALAIVAALLARKPLVAS